MSESAEGFRSEEERQAARDMEIKKREDHARSLNKENLRKMGRQIDRDIAYDKSVGITTSESDAARGLGKNMRDSNIIANSLKIDNTEIDVAHDEADDEAETMKREKKAQETIDEKQTISEKERKEYGISRVNAIREAIEAGLNEEGSRSSQIVAFRDRLEASGYMTEADAKLINHYLNYPGMPGKDQVRELFSGYNIPNPPDLKSLQR